MFTVKVTTVAFNNGAVLSPKQIALICQRNAEQPPKPDLRQWSPAPGTMIYLQDLKRAHPGTSLDLATDQLLALAARAGAMIQGDWPTTYFVVPKEE